MAQQPSYRPFTGGNPGYFPGYPSPYPGPMYFTGYQQPGYAAPPYGLPFFNNPGFVGSQRTSVSIVGITKDSVTSSAI